MLLSFSVWSLSHIKFVQQGRDGTFLLGWKQTAWFDTGISYIYMDLTCELNRLLFWPNVRVAAEWMLFDNWEGTWCSPKWELPFWRSTVISATLPRMILLPLILYTLYRVADWCRSINSTFIVIEIWTCAINTLKKTSWYVINERK